MVFGDNIGGRGFHNQFIAVMNEVKGRKTAEGCQ